MIFTPSKKTSVTALLKYDITKLAGIPLKWVKINIFD